MFKMNKLGTTKLNALIILIVAVLLITAYFTLKDTQVFIACMLFLTTEKVLDYFYMIKPYDDDDKKGSSNG